MRAVPGCTRRRMPLHPQAVRRCAGSPFEQSAEVVDARRIVLRGLLCGRHLSLSLSLSRVVLAVSGCWKRESEGGANDGAQAAARGAGLEETRLTGRNNMHRAWRHRWPCRLKRMTCSNAEWAASREPHSLLASPNHLMSCSLICSPPASGVMLLHRWYTGRTGQPLLLERLEPLRFAHSSKPRIPCRDRMVLGGRSRRQSGARARIRYEGASDGIGQ